MSALETRRLFPTVRRVQAVLLVRREPAPKVAPPIPTCLALPTSEASWEAFMKDYNARNYPPSPQSEQFSELMQRWEELGPPVTWVPAASGPPQVDEDQKGVSGGSADEERPDDHLRPLPYDSPIHVLFDERYPFERLCRGDFTFRILHPQRLTTLKLDIEDMHPADDLLRRLTTSNTGILEFVRKFNLRDRRLSGAGRPPLTPGQLVHFIQLLPNCTRLNFADVTIDGSAGDVHKAMETQGVSPRSADAFDIKFSKAFTSKVRHDLLEVLLAPFSKLESLTIQLHSSHQPEEPFILPKGCFRERFVD